MSNIARAARKSTWTPLSNEEANQKFEKWTDQQRRIVISDIVKLCKGKQIDYIGDVINEKKPVYKDDFTRVLPRVLTLYILSYLDPRSLCRAAQVSWYWKYLTELDHLWMPKCCSLGWILPFSPSPYEDGVWKRLYLENIIALKCMVPKKKKEELLRDISDLSLSQENGGHKSSHSLQGGASGSKRPPWRGSDPNPQDMWRNNYLENTDDVKKVNNLRQKHLYGPMADEIIRKAKNKVRTGQHAARIKAMHTERLEYTPHIDGRPDWAQTHEHSDPFRDKALLKAMPDASLRPNTSTTTVELRKAWKQRTECTTAAKPLFENENSTWEVHMPNNIKAGEL